MKILLDTHTFLWFIEGSSNLSPTARGLIEDSSNRPFLSVASLWEMAIKISLGKLRLNQPYESLIPEQLDFNGIEILGIGLSHAAAIVTLPFHHRDPFDRLLIAQAMVENMPLVSADSAFDTYSVNRLW